MPVFFSKDAILYAAMTAERGGVLLWLAGAAGALMTAFYMFRLLFRVFFGTCTLSLEEQQKVHESPTNMTLPLQALAALSIVGGWVGIPLIAGANVFGDFLAPVFGGHVEAHHEVVFEILMMVFSLAIAFIGIYAAYNLYVLKNDGGSAYAELWPGIHRLLVNKYYVDEIYDALIVQPIKRASIWCWRVFEDGLVDAAVNGAGFFVRSLGGVLRHLQTGYVKSYAVSMLVGALVILLYLTAR